MKCGYSENDIALYVENDLPVARQREMEMHLVKCGACRKLAEESRESQSVFKSLRQETVTASALASVRERIMSQVAAEQPARFWFPLWLRRGFALAGVALFAVLCIGVWNMGKQPMQVQQLTPAVKSATVEEPGNSLPGSGGAGGGHKVQKKPARKLLPPLAPPKTGGESLGPKQIVVKLLTDDPNVVIYWLVDQNGGEQ